MLFYGDAARWSNSQDVCEVSCRESRGQIARRDGYILYALTLRKPKSMSLQFHFQQKERPREVGSIAFRMCTDEVIELNPEGADPPHSVSM